MILNFKVFLFLWLTAFQVVITQHSNAQNDSVSRYKPVSADCSRAIPLKIFKRSDYGPTVAPEGFGELKEITAKSRNSTIAFEKEHNTAWYLLTMYFDGEIIFDIIPVDSNDDYDFILYHYTDSSFCTLLKENRATVVRSNIRRNDTVTKGRTGLAAGAENELQAQGPGAQYSKSLKVKKREQYMLVLDNVYKNGKGHTLKFNYIKEVNISGIVRNDEGKKLAATVTLSDGNGLTVAETKANDSGQYSLSARINEFTDYQLTFIENGSFSAVETINTRQLKDSGSFSNIRTILPKLKKGKKYKMGNINFYGSSPELLPGSYPSVHALYKLMMHNRKMKIQIEGHVNAPGFNPDEEQYQKLSEWRANTIYNYLLEHGIEKDRMDAVGLSNRFMLFPRPLSEEQQAANRRVEINVISFDKNEK